MITVTIRCRFGDFDEDVTLQWNQTVDFLTGYVAGKAKASLYDKFGAVYDQEQLRGDMTLENLDGETIEIVATGNSV